MTLDQSTSLERLRLECLDIRTQVEQSTDTDDRPPDDAHTTPSDVGSACDEEDVTARSTDITSQCLVHVNELSTTAAADDQLGENCLGCPCLTINLAINH